MSIFKIVDLSDSFSEKQISGNLEEKSSKQTQKKTSSLAPRDRTSTNKNPSLQKTFQNLAKSYRMVGSRSTLLGTESAKSNNNEYKISMGAPQASSSFEKNPNIQMKNSIKIKPASAPPKFSKESTSLKKTITTSVKPKNIYHVSNSNASSQVLTRQSTPSNFKPPNSAEKNTENGFKKNINKYSKHPIKSDFLSKIKPLTDNKQEFSNKKPLSSQKISNEISREEGIKHITDNPIDNDNKIFQNRFDKMQNDFDLIKEQIKFLQIQQENLIQKVSEISNKLDGIFIPTKSN